MFIRTRVLHPVIFKLANAQLNIAASSSRLASHEVRLWGERGHASNSYTRKQQGNEEDFGLDDVDAQIETVIREERKKMKDIKFRKIHRQMRLKGAPERKLTWEAIDQIRFLKQESPEEWTIQRLAEGFSVTPNEISRILHSKFSPSPERKKKQDTMVLAKQQQQSLSDGTKVQATLPPGSSTLTTLLPGVSALVAQQSHGMTKVDSKKVTQFCKSSTAISLGPSKVSSALSTRQVITTVPTHHKDDNARGKSVELVEDEEEEEDYSEDEEVWDGVRFSDEELQDFAQTMSEKHTPVVQRGTEYFDTSGNFLYRL